MNRGEARRITQRLARPEGLTNHQWCMVQALLLALVDHYPTICPGQKRLAAKLNVHPGNVWRYTRLAKELGLLETVRDAGVRRFRTGQKTLRYTLPYLTGMHSKSRALNARDFARRSTSGTTYLPYLTESPEGDSLKRNPGGAARRPALRVLQPRGKPMINDDQPDEEMTPSRKRRRVGGFGETTTVKPLGGSPSRRLVDHFQERWADVILLKTEYRERKCMERGAAIGYIKNTFLAPATGVTFTEEQVREMIDAFMDQMKGSLVSLREGQTPWQRFTGWWGRTTVASAAARKRMMAEQVAKYRGGRFG